MKSELGGKFFANAETNTLIGPYHEDDIQGRIRAVTYLTHLSRHAEPDIYVIEAPDYVTAKRRFAYHKRYEKAA